ncbi:hypothetical protein [Pseudonocardia sp.]|uniref:hypothetical protein n=1 Tax=Pseudonocardia sp. TaxID=60912 RepID=UPI002630050C|nr:hypothetical protein [Pseudonocardia sp.]
MTAPAPVGRTIVPGRYRGVPVAALPSGVGLDERSLRACVVGREAYRRTRSVVARSAAGIAVPRLLDGTCGAKAFAVLLDQLTVPGPVVHRHTGGPSTALTRLQEAAP